MYPIWEFIALTIQLKARYFDQQPNGESLSFYKRSHLLVYGESCSVHQQKFNGFFFGAVICVFSQSGLRIDANASEYACAKRYFH